MSSIPDVGPREAWLRQATTLAWITIGWNVLEGLVAMGFGVAEESVALFGFGVDSWIEVGSAVVVLWRLAGERGAVRALDRERRATQGIGVLMGLLGVGIAAGGAQAIASGGHPATTVPGVVVAALSLLFMAFLWRAKVRVADGLGSRAMKADAACSRACMQLSVVLLAGSALYAVAPAMWWADGVAAIALGFLVGREGVENWREARKPQFEGGCCSGCHAD
jgi:divalent metal cation (Fe/Co/Zn/Cd) transporter